ncbi:4663_t:CDS:2, partial [Gigaspora rosea]
KAIKFARIRSIVKVNERQLLKVDPLVLYHELPGHLRSSNRKTHGMDMELWLVEGQECLIIPEDITQINVWLKDLDRPVEYEYFVTEILYGFNDSNFKNINDDDIEKVNIISNLIPKKFINIVLWNKWSKTRTNNEGWSTKLSSQHPLFHDLQLTYSEYFSIRSAFLYDKLDFFNYILYTIIENNKKSNQLKFHVGDIIEIEEESEGLTYAKIQAILQHQANNTESAIFFVLKWFQKTNTKDLILDCLYYKQIMNDQ